MSNDFIREIQVPKLVFDKNKLKVGDKIIYKHRKGFYSLSNKNVWDEILECEIYKVEDEDLYLKHMGDIISLSTSDLENNLFYKLEQINNI